MKKIATLVLIGLTLSVTPALSGASGAESGKPAPDKSAAKDARQETGDAAEAIKNYSIEKRDEAAQKAREALDELDARINSLETQIDKDWDKMSKSAREQARKSMKALHRQRIKAAEWYGSLQSSTANAWEHTKKGFSEAYRDLKNAWEKAEREYREKERSQKQ